MRASLLRPTTVWAAVTAQWWLGRRAQRGYEQLPIVTLSPRGTDAAPATTVSVVVPARNEAANLPVLLEGLCAQRPAAHEIIVVDDQSDDGSGEVARRFPVRVIDAPPLPPGWAGKPHACALGAAAASGDWLLFVDADTTHAPNALDAAHRYVTQYKLDALSLFCGQRCLSFWERLLLPYAYRHYFAGFNAQAVNDPRSRFAAANGQYFLIRRELYQRIGGHEAVRASIVEDVALARLLKHHQARYQLARGNQLVQVRMYDGFAAIHRGFAKNSTRFLLENPRPGLLTLVSTLLDGLAPLLLGLALRRRSPATGAAAAVSLAVAAAELRPWLRWFGVDERLALLQPLAAAAFQLIALQGVQALRPGQTQWKGRRY